MKKPMMKGKGGAMTDSTAPKSKRHPPKVKSNALKGGKKDKKGY